MQFRLKLAVAVAVLGAAAVGSAAIAHDRHHSLEAFLHGFEEVPAVSTGAIGEFDAVISRDESRIDWKLTYGGTFNGTITQAHVHFAQKSVNGAIAVWFCKTTQAAPPGTQDCVQPAPGKKVTLTGTWRPADIAPTVDAQGIGAGEFAELIRALRAGVAYANVHSNTQPGGEIRGQVSDGRGNDH
ncbi:MAG TPA: CHRD domain-containing protein [Solirubrobacter sp.]|nr:CHRD domain-containing protein [Solirubrobacter sp.]